MEEEIYIPVWCVLCAEYVAIDANNHHPYHMTCCGDVFDWAKTEDFEPKTLDKVNEWIKKQ